MLKQSTFLVTVTILHLAGFAQPRDVRAELEKALTQKNFTEAGNILEARLNFIFESKLFDSLPNYTFYVGKIEEKKLGVDAAIHAVQAYLSKVKALPTQPRTLARIYSEAGEFYGSVGKYEQAYQINQQAYQLAEQAAGIPPDFLASLDSDLGTYAFRKGDVSLAQYHHRKAVQVFLRSKNPDHESLYVAANNMGSQMWLSSKTDSAVYYFNIALNALAKTEKTPINQYYRPAVLKNNLAALYRMEGSTTKAIEAMRSCIQNVRIYLSIPEAVAKKPQSASFQFEAIDNLGGIYKELGDYSQALSLETYSYQQKQQHRMEDPAAVYKSQILLGQLYFDMKDHTRAEQFLTSGLTSIAREEGDYLFWQADACNALALLYDAKHNTQLAKRYYEKADSLYEASLQGEYDDIYLEFLRNASLFYAENANIATAVTKANKGFDYVKKTQGTETLLAFYQLMNLAEVFLRAGDYQRSLAYAKQGIAVVDKKLQTSGNLLDSVKTLLKKPKAILLQAKAEYHLLKNKNVYSLSALLQKLDAAVNILEKRKQLISDPKDIGLMMEDHADLLNFIKKLTLDLYQLTNDQGYIDRLMNLQESGTYTRIRSRLEKLDTIQFAQVPGQVQEKEKQLREAINTALKTANAQHAEMAGYFSAVENWKKFQESVKRNYPRYYQLKYGSILSNLENIQKAIPERTTVIRYLFIDKDLFVVVMDKQHKQLMPLNTDGVEQNIRLVSDYSKDIAATTRALYELYEKLWDPMRDQIQNSRVIIIPDGILFNLSFEMLTPKRINRFEDLATSSLLSKYTFSYHYSVSLIGNRANRSRIKSNERSNFIAFVPGFLDEDKKRYAAAVKDSFQLDRDYITLLPQPFMVDFAGRVSKLLGGSMYINSASTVTSFKNNAGGHKIIHIGTHAEANNLAPEFSRLIFSKGAANETNSVFLGDIYHYDLTSELAVLTACESGKPGYQDGEGMISLAHAFNYAGSESILTGLWKIDEKASTVLMDAFYKNLLSGMDKDEALRQAKLYYLQTSNGRMLAPQYWAGLILMGDTSPVTVTKERPSVWPWIAGAILLLATVVLLIKRAIPGKRQPITR